MSTEQLRRRARLGAYPIRVLAFRDSSLRMLTPILTVYSDLLGVDAAG